MRRQPRLRNREARLLVPRRSNVRGDGLFPRYSVLPPNAGHDVDVDRKKEPRRGGALASTRGRGGGKPSRSSPTRGARNRFRASERAPRRSMIRSGVQPGGLVTRTLPLSGGGGGETPFRRCDGRGGCIRRRALRPPRDRRYECDRGGS